MDSHNTWTNFWGARQNDPLTGGPQLSAEGQQFARHVQEAHALGITDQANQLKYAKNMIGAQRARSGKHDSDAQLEGEKGNQMSFRVSKIF